MQWVPTKQARIQGGVTGVTGPPLTNIYGSQAICDPPPPIVFEVTLVGGKSIRCN